MENQKSDIQPSSAPQELLKPPLQPLDLKKTGLPLYLIIGLVIAGFAGTTVLFAVFSKPNAQKQALKREAATVLVSPAQTTIVEVAPTLGFETAAESVPKEEKPIPLLTLSGILYGENGSLALINGRVVREGAMIEGARLEKVSADRAELSFEGQKIILRAK
ncbi:MAG: general secretion pathway protein GspB [Candidatus Omnitrophica bacterium]|nr:general secretion pathway protein GspB [Candidatus Omnitrophota bacterium]